MLIYIREENCVEIRSQGEKWIEELSCIPTIALFSFMFRALFSKNLGPFSSESESKAGGCISGGDAISLFPLLDLRVGNFIATFRGIERLSCLLYCNFSLARKSFSLESDSNFYQKPILLFMNDTGLLYGLVWHARLFKRRTPTWNLGWFILFFWSFGHYYPWNPLTSFVVLQSAQIHRKREISFTRKSS